ncbi:hypothetical protein N9N13_08490 [Opitutales bacterium]|nr:hypothetical protein [Opitutales bacterium]
MRATPDGPRRKRAATIRIPRFNQGDAKYAKTRHATAPISVTAAIMIRGCSPVITYLFATKIQIESIS